MVQRLIELLRTVDVSESEEMRRSALHLARVMTMLIFNLKVNLAILPQLFTEMP